MALARPGLIVFTVCLIGVEIMFLVQRAAGLSRAEAWPMLIVLVGVAMLVSTALHRPRPRLCRVSLHLAYGVDHRRVGPVGQLDRHPGCSAHRRHHRLGPVIIVALGVWFVIDGLFLIERESIEATESTLDHSAVQGEGDGEPTPSRNKTDPSA